MSAPDILRATKRADLNRRLRNAKARLKRAEDDVDDLEGELAEMDVKEALEWITAWRGVPDWQGMLRGENTMPVAMLRDHMLRRLGFGHGFNYVDSGEVALGVSVAPGLEGASAGERLDRIRRGIEFMLPLLKPHESDGLLWFPVSGENIQGFALTLHIARDQSVIKLIKHVYTRVVEETTFETLGEALLRIQVDHPGDDELDDYVPDPATAPGETGEMLRLAIVAFIEGRRMAGLPIEDDV